MRVTNLTHLESRTVDLWNVVYSHYDILHNPDPFDGDLCQVTDDLDDIAVHGEVMFVMPADPFWDEKDRGLGGEKSQEYRSEPVHNPTWWRVAQLADEMVEVVRDRHHIYFEDIQLMPTDPDGPPLRVARFIMGS